MEAEEYVETSLCPQILKFVNISDQIHSVYQLKQSTFHPTISYNQRHGIYKMVSGNTPAI